MHESLALFFTVGERIVVLPDIRCFLSPLKCKLLLTKLLECGCSCGFKFPYQHLLSVSTGSGLTTKIKNLVEGAIISASVGSQTSSSQCEVFS